MYRIEIKCSLWDSPFFLYVEETHNNLYCLIKMVGYWNSIHPSLYKYEITDIQKKSSDEVPSSYEEMKDGYTGLIYFREFK